MDVCWPCCPVIQARGLKVRPAKELWLGSRRRNGVEAGQNGAEREQKVGGVSMGELAQGWRQNFALGQILASVPGLGAPNLAAWSCATYFCSAALSSPIQTTANVFFSSWVAPPSPGLDMGQECQLAFSNSWFGLYCKRGVIPFGAS